jgi:NAD(P)-dependent dehydrogenase (short-subunit alcohol dehydrogenase family)
MLKQGGGAILNTASVAGVFGGMAGVSYTVSKHAFIGLTRSTAAHGAAQPNPMGLELLSKLAAAIPRMGEPMEIAKLALFLVSEDASNVNGSCIVIDGGWTNF